MAEDSLQPERVAFVANVAHREGMPHRMQATADTFHGKSGGKAIEVLEYFSPPEFFPHLPSRKYNLPSAPVI